MHVCFGLFLLATPAPFRHRVVIVAGGSVVRLGGPGGGGAAGSLHGFQRGVPRLPPGRAGGPAGRTVVFGRVKLCRKKKEWEVGIKFSDLP